jgi:hypothetical protein
MMAHSTVEEIIELAKTRPDLLELLLREAYQMGKEDGWRERGELEKKVAK